MPQTILFYDLLCSKEKWMGKGCFIRLRKTL